MSPAVTGLLGVDEVCNSCMAKLDTGALKCSKCQNLIHLSCSGLPEYQMVRFAVSQAQYLCMRCCKTDTGEQKYEDELMNIKDLLDREKLLIVPPVSDPEPQPDPNEGPEQLDCVVPFSSLLNMNAVANSDRRRSEGRNDNSDHNNNVNDSVTVPLSRPPGETVMTIPPPPICKFYTRRECQHGRSGKNCKFSHPKICPSFSRNGDRRGGCTKGRSCQEFHPKVCRESLEKKECSRNKCRFLPLEWNQINLWG